ncbi:MAG: crossover junction endodeoxyribonuclease RuvC [Clostridia bacterium]|nr:MAG: crossover junction endodeoxyribonuclease RuvC [Clostridia bacterium]
MRVLGIDPGVATTGYAILEETSALKLQPVTFGCIRSNPEAPLPARLETIYGELKQIVASCQPEAVAVEELFFNKNSRTALLVSQARGVVLLLAAHAGLPVCEYTPLQVKQAVSGYGRAPKQQVQKMVQLLLHLDAVPRPDDVADALAVAVCHLHSYRYLRVAEQ